MTDDTLPHSPAAERNRDPILAVLVGLLPERCRVLEIASGTGQHAQHFGSARPGWQWQPTDADALSLPGIAARCAAMPNVSAPVHLDVLQPWPAALATFVWQDFTGLPSSSTVHAPHCPSPQPYLLPVSASSSRSTLSSVRSESASTRWRRPFTVSSIVIARSSCARSSGCAAEGAGCSVDP